MVLLAAEYGAAKHSAAHLARRHAGWVRDVVARELSAFGRKSSEEESDPPIQVDFVVTTVVVSILQQKCLGLPFWSPQEG